VIRPGYVPRGGGVIELSVRPVRRALAPLQLTEQGAVREVSGIAISSHLQERQVSERMASVCEIELAAAGLPCKIERVHDHSAPHPGASLAVWATTSTGCILGADRAGALRRSSETIGHFVARTLVDDWQRAPLPTATRPTSSCSLLRSRRAPRPTWYLGSATM